MVTTVPGPTWHSLAQPMEPPGDGRSGMAMHLSGLDPHGQPHTRSREILARQNHGPHIPCLAALALARKLAAGTLTQRGTMPCLGLLSLDDYLNELATLDVEVLVY